MLGLVKVTFTLGFTVSIKPAFVKIIYIATSAKKFTKVTVIIELRVATVDHVEFHASLFC